LESFLKRNPELIATIVLVGADVAVSLWQPSDETQAKMAILDVLRSGELAFAALTTAKGLAALALAVAVGSGIGIAVAAVALLPTIAVHAHAAVTGQRPSPYVKVTKVTIDGVEITFPLVDQPDVWVPRKVVVSRGDKVLVAVERAPQYPMVCGFQGYARSFGAALSGTVSSAPCWLG
jgi:hypothetical protein